MEKRGLPRLSSFRRIPDLPAIQDFGRRVGVRDRRRNPEKATRFPRIKYGAGSVKHGMTSDATLLAAG